MENLLFLIPILVLAGVILGLILFFSPIIIICRLGKISVTLQEMNEKIKEKT